MPPDTFLGRIRFLVLQPVDAVTFIRTQSRDQLGELKAAALALVAFDFAFGWMLHRNAAVIMATPGIGETLYSVLNGAWFVFDPFAICMAIYIFTRR